MTRLAIQVDMEDIPPDDLVKLCDELVTLVWNAVDVETAPLMVRSVVAA